MIAYINKPLARLVFMPSTQKFSILLVVPLVTGDLLACFSISWVLKRFNIRTLFACAFSLATTVLIFLSVLDYLVGVHGQDFTGIAAGTRNKALATYITLSFLLGLGLAYTTGVISTFLGTIYLGRRRAHVISASNGLYNVGAGFVPLVLSQIVFKLTIQTNFSLLRGFLIIATVACALAVACALFLNYRFADYGHDLNLRSKKSTPSQAFRRNHNKQLLLKVGPYMLLCLLFFDLAELNSGFGLNNYVGSNERGTLALIRGIGLFFMMKGLWSFVSLIIFKKVKYRYFVLVMACFVAAGFALLAANLLHANLKLIYLVAALLGIGIGNTFSVLFAFFQGTQEEKRAWIGVMLSIGRMITYEMGVWIIALVPQLSANSRMIFSIVVATLLFMVFGLMTRLSQMARKHHLFQPLEAKTTNS